MNAKDILAKVKAIFNAPVAPVQAAEPQEPAMPGMPATTTGVDVPLQDGTVLSVSPDLQVGATATIEGQPAPAGEYVAQDGATITVDESGMVINVAQPEPMAADVPPAPTFEQRIAVLEDAIKRLSTPAPTPVQYATEVQLQEATTKIEKQDKVIEGLFELCEKLAETPTTEPQTLTGNKKDRFEKSLSKEKKIEGIATAITQLKNKK